jgi:hypothetical protein
MMLDRLDEADRDIARALDVSHRLGNPPQRWRTLVAAGDLRTKQGRVDEADALYREANATIDAVASALRDDAVRDTFLRSKSISEIRAKAR